jgi:hypothetical protein
LIYPPSPPKKHQLPFRQIRKNTPSYFPIAAIPSGRDQDV